MLPHPSPHPLPLWVLECSLFRAEMQKARTRKKCGNWGELGRSCPFLESLFGNFEKWAHAPGEKKIEIEPTLSFLARSFSYFPVPTIRESRTGYLFTWNFRDAEIKLSQKIRPKKVSLKFFWREIKWRYTDNQHCPRITYQSPPFFLSLIPRFYGIEINASRQANIRYECSDEIAIFWTKSRKFSAYEFKFPQNREI